MRPDTADIEPVLPAIAPGNAPVPAGRARLPRSARAGRVGPLAVLAAASLHGAALLSLINLRHEALPPPPPAMAVTLEVLPAPTQAAAAASTEVAATPAPEPAAAPHPPQAATVPLSPKQAASPPEQALATEPPAPESQARRPPTEAAAAPIPPAKASIPLSAPEPPAPAPRRPSRHVARLRPTPEHEEPEPDPAAPRAAPGPATPPSAAAPAPAQPRSAAAPAAVSRSWAGQLGAWVQAHKSYPEAARDRGEEGTAAVRFTVARDGRVLDASLVGGSGVGLLDAAALAMLRGARVPPFPEAMPQAEITVTVAIRYSLER